MLTLQSGACFGGARNTYGDRASPYQRGDFFMTTQVTWTILIIN